MSSGGTSGATFAIAVRDGTDLFLILSIRRGPKGDVYVNWPRPHDPKWKPHASFHASGQHHQKSFDHKFQNKASWHSSLAPASRPSRTSWRWDGFRRISQAALASAHLGRLRQARSKVSGTHPRSRWESRYTSASPSLNPNRLAGGTSPPCRWRRRWPVGLSLPVSYLTAAT